MGDRVLIHASQGASVKPKVFFEIVRDDMKLTRFPKDVNDFEYGAVIGSAVLKSVVRNSKSEWIEGGFYWVLSKVKKLPQKKLKGMLGLFRVKEFGIKGCRPQFNLGCD